jgi:hypothetical protein
MEIKLYNNTILTIIPETHSGEYVGGYKHEDAVRAAYCYLHGELDKRNGFDVCSLLRSELLPQDIEDTWWLADSFQEGIYKCTCFNEPCLFFRWSSSIQGDRMKGLIVLESDHWAVKDAYSKYSKKTYSI